jgi:FkbM family methyltransferase
MTPARALVLGLRRVGLLKKLDFDLPVKRSGRVTWIPLIRGQGVLNVVEFEPFMDVLIRRAAPLFPGTFLDIGVNVAQTLIKAKNIFPAIAYVGFEPNPVCVKYVERVVRRNGYTNVILVPAGLTDHDGEGALTMWQDGADDPSASLIPDMRTATASQRQVTVPLLRWKSAEVQYAIGILGFVKIDVEGGELEVMRELAERLRTDRPIVAVEVLPSYDPPMPARLERQEALVSMLRGLQYRILRVHKKGDDVRLEAIDGFGIHSDLGLIDHLLVPIERAVEVIAAFM